jgi:hypothetical protein
VRACGLRSSVLLPVVTSSDRPGITSRHGGSRSPVGASSSQRPWGVRNGRGCWCQPGPRPPTVASFGSGPGASTTTLDPHLEVRRVQRRGSRNRSASPGCALGLRDGTGPAKRMTAQHPCRRNRCQSTAWDTQRGLLA